MIKIVPAKTEDFGIIRDIAYQTWPNTYGHILSETQLNYMLDCFYSIEAIAKNSNEHQHFLLAFENEKPLAFVSYENNYKKKPVTRIHKIYLLPESQRKGIGKLLIDTVVGLAHKAKSQKLSLNVNRYNKAVDFYQKQGFEIVGEEDIALAHGYLMEDFRMEKNLNPL